jgi:hypothetical protein
MSDTDIDPTARRQWTIEEIREANVIRGPSTPEEAAFYVQQGVMTPEDAAFLLENRLRTDALFQRDFDRRLRELIRAWESRPKTKGGRTRYEKDDWVLDLHARALKLRKENLGMTWQQVADHLGVDIQALHRYRRRLGSFPAI